MTADLVYLANFLKPSAYTQSAFIFHPLRGFRIFHVHIVTFVLFLL